MNIEIKRLLRPIASTLLPVTCLLLQSCSFSQKTSKRLFRNAEHETFDAIIVPGVPFEGGQWGRVMKGRVYWAKYLYDRGMARNIIFSGSAVYTPYYESKIMALYAQALGIPARNIYTESRAEHSTENVYYSYKKAKLLGFHKIAIASDPFQTKLLKRYARKRVSADIKLIPFVVDTLRIIEPSMIDPAIDYQQAFKTAFVSLVKRENMWQRFRGTRGGNVDTTAYRTVEDATR